MTSPTGIQQFLPVKFRENTANNKHYLKWGYYSAVKTRVEQQLQIGYIFENILMHYVWHCIFGDTRISV